MCIFNNKYQKRTAAEVVIYQTMTLLWNDEQQYVFGRRCLTTVSFSDTFRDASVFHKEP